MIVKYIEGLLHRIRTRKIPYIERLSSGSMQTIEDYRNICGKIHGLDEAEGIVKDLYKELFENQPFPRKDINDDNEFY